MTVRRKARDWHVMMGWQERPTVVEASCELLHPRWFAASGRILCLDLLLGPSLHLASLLLGHSSCGESVLESTKVKCDRRSAVVLEVGVTSDAVAANAQ